MASGYNTAKAKSANKKQSQAIKENFKKNVDASPNIKFDGMIAKNINISDLYSAPDSWNFYEILDENKKLELMQSIEENGILSPIVVWEMDKSNVEDLYGSDLKYSLIGNKYMILSGHNRTDAYNRLYKLTGEEKYKSIPAFVFYENDLDKLSAREIIIDTNYVQRVLNTREMEMSIMYKYDEINNNKSKKGRTRDIVANELGISSAKVEQYRKLNGMMKELKDMVYNDDLALTSVLKLADKSIDVQGWVYNMYGTRLTNKLLNKVKPYMRRDDIEKLFEKELSPKIKTQKVSIEVPEELIDDFKIMASKWIYEKTKRD